MADWRKQASTSSRSSSGEKKRSARSARPRSQGSAERVLPVATARAAVCPLCGRLNRADQFASLNLGLVKMDICVSCVRAGVGLSRILERLLGRSS